MPQNAEATAAEPGDTLHRLFEEQARRSPGALAVRCGEDELTYRLLDQKANRLARFLRARGLRVGDRVAVSMDRSPDLIVAMLAVLKADGAFVPVEPSAPEPLIRGVLAAARPTLVLTHESQRLRLADAADGPLVCLDTEAPGIAREADGILGSETGARDLACVFFTSGSSGEPKSALIEHGNLLTAYRGWQEVFAFAAGERHLQTTSLEFDVFTADWIRALCSGGTLVLTKRNFTLDRTATVEELRPVVLAQKIDVMEVSVLLARRLSAHLRATGKDLGRVRLLMVGGDKWYLDEHLRLQEHLGGGVRVLNTYGVAEASVDNAYFEPSMLGGAAPDRPRRVSLIGRAFPGTQLSVVDPAGGRACAVGEPGEIRLSGPSVGRTAAGEHRTGDVGILRADGHLEYLGRIEPNGTPAETVALARLEGVVREHPDVAECAVIDMPLPRGGHLRAAYVVPADPEQALDTEAIRRAAVRAHAADPEPVTTPAAARPLAAVIPVPVLPRTRAGKIDRRQLPLPAPDRSGAVLGAVGWGVGSAKSGMFGVATGGSLKGRAAGTGAGAGFGVGCAWFVSTLIFTTMALALTRQLWPGSTDLSSVPTEWHAAFHILYLIEDIAFGLGVSFLLFGRPLLRRLGRGPVRTTAAHLAVVWLLASWWPQDNSYRTTSSTDWSAQASLVYGFNVTLMLAAVVLVVFFASRRHEPAG